MYKLLIRKKNHIKKYLYLTFKHYDTKLKKKKKKEKRKKKKEKKRASRYLYLCHPFSSQRNVLDKHALNKLNMYLPFFNHDWSKDMDSAPELICMYLLIERFEFWRRDATLGSQKRQLVVM